MAATVHIPDAPVASDVVDQVMPRRRLQPRLLRPRRSPGIPGTARRVTSTDRGWALVVACDPIGTGDSSCARGAAHHRAGGGRAGRRSPLAAGPTGRPATLAGRSCRSAPGAIVLGLRAVDGRLLPPSRRRAGTPSTTRNGILGFSARHTELPLPEGTFGRRFRRPRTAAPPARKT